MVNSGEASERFRFRFSVGFSMAKSMGAPSNAARVAAATMALSALATFCWLVTLVPQVSAGEPLRLAMSWVPSLGVELAIRIDGLSLLFGLLITGIGVFIAIYSHAYLLGHPHAARLLIILIAFMASMLGLVLADDLITLFVFWELTTVTSFLLIGFDHDNDRARRNAWQALLVTAIGGLALLAGLLILGNVSGTFVLSEVTAQGGRLQGHPLYAPILILVLIGAFTKSAQFPFHGWLPNAMAAPTPISAYLHSATMVKAGIYLLARLHPTLGGTDLWMWTLTIVGAVTAVWASIVAVRQTDLKLALAYTTVMALGTLTMFLGADARIAIAAAVTFLLVHSLYKCALFLIIGIIDHGTGTREVDRLGGLARAMPITLVATAAATLSMAGFPPFLGFIGKELKYEGALAVASEPVLVVAAAVAANGLMVFLAGVVLLRPFFARPKEPLVVAHPTPFAMLVGPVILGALGLTFGLLPPLISDSLIQPAVSSILGAPAAVKLALWHGVNVPLLLSVVTLGIGLLLLARERAVRTFLAGTLARLPATFDSIYDLIMAGFARGAAGLTVAMQTGSLRWYLGVLFTTTTLGVGAALFATSGDRIDMDGPALSLLEGLILALVAVGTLLPAFVRSRLTSVCGLGLAGSGIALLFLIHGAPDVAMTQLLVEICFVVILAVLMLRLPRLQQSAHTTRMRRHIHAVIATAFGGVMAVLTLSVIDTPLSRHLTDYFEAVSVPEAYGRNIVNVILVDFRALDTLGEIVVVVTAGLAAYGLIRIKAYADARP